MALRYAHDDKRAKRKAMAALEAMPKRNPSMIFPKETAD